MFISLTSDIRWCGTKELTDKLSSSVDCICNYIYDLEWQYSVNSILRKNTECQQAIFIVMRLLHAKDIEEHKIKSYYRYDKIKNRLAIDIVFPLEDYVNLPEREITKCISRELYDYMAFVLPKYEKRLIDFDVNKFLPILKERIDYLCEICDRCLIIILSSKILETNNIGDTIKDKTFISSIYTNYNEELRSIIRTVYVVRTGKYKLEFCYLRGKFNYLMAEPCEEQDIENEYLTFCDDASIFSDKDFVNNYLQENVEEGCVKSGNLEFHISDGVVDSLYVLQSESKECKTE